jgi:hypothetical protein
MFRTTDVNLGHLGADLSILRCKERIKKLVLNILLSFWPEFGQGNDVIVIHRIEVVIERPIFCQNAQAVRKTNWGSWEEQAMERAIAAMNEGTSYRVY